MIKIGILFPGQGTQCLGMGQSLVEHIPFARKRYEEASEILGYDLIKLCTEGPIEKLTDSRYCQPALFVHGVVAFEFLKTQFEANLHEIRKDASGENRNLQPDIDHQRDENSGESNTEQYVEIAVSAGISIGSLAALSIAGAYDFETGVCIAQKRGELIQAACEETHGGMASILGVSVDQVQELCAATGVEMSNINCEGQIVISGEKAWIDEAVSKTAALTGGRAIPLNVAGAFHSSLMKSACKPLASFLKPMQMGNLQWPVVSNVTGEVIHNVTEVKQLLVDQIVSPVLWWRCMQTAASLGVRRFYQCGPGKTLVGMAKRIAPELKVTVFGEYSDSYEI